LLETARGPMPTRVIRPTSSLGITTQWSTTLSSKVNLPHVINFRAKYGANLVTEPSNFEVTKPSDSTEWVSVLVLNQGLSLFLSLDRSEGVQCQNALGSVLL
jgi:hypothetical protein